MSAAIGEGVAEVESPEGDERFRSALRCPRCRGTLAGDRDLGCAACGLEYPLESGVLRLIDPAERGSAAERFFNSPEQGQWGRGADEMPEVLVDWVRGFLDELQPGLIVEIGSGMGVFDGSAPGYVAVDYAFSALRDHSSGRRVQASAERLPFADDSLTAIFSVDTLEHVPDPAAAMREIDRTLAPGGRAFLRPAWYVPRWASSGVEYRDYGELSPRERLSKLSLTVRRNRVLRMLGILPARVRRELDLRRGRVLEMEYVPLRPNLSAHLGSDSDAFASLDPHAAIAFFLSRGYRMIPATPATGRILHRYQPVVAEKPVAAGVDGRAR